MTSHIFKIRKHNYTPDFVILKCKVNKKINVEKHINDIKYVIDIKGGKASPYANLRFDLFALRYHIPVIIVKFREQGIIFKVRGQNKIRHSLLGLEDD